MCTFEKMTFDGVPDPEAARVGVPLRSPPSEPGPGDRVRAICQEMARIAGQISAGSFRPRTGFRPSLRVP